MNNKEIICRLRKELDFKRYEHTCGVAYTSAALAMRWDADVNKAYLAGLLHDCAKGMSDDDRLDICKKKDIYVSEVEHDNPSLLHAKVGAYLAKTVYEIDDEEILSAITYHTTGRAEMTLLEKIVFSADYLEPNRNHDPELPMIRRMAFTDLDEAILKIYENTMRHLKNSTKVLDPTTEEAYRYYQEYVRRHI